MKVHHILCEQNLKKNSVINDLHLREKYEKLRQKYDQDRESISKLRSELTLEKLKNTLFSHIINTRTDLRVDDILRMQNGAVHIYNYENGDIPIVVHDGFKEQRYDIQKNSKTIYRSVKHAKEEDREEIEEVENKKESKLDEKQIIERIDLIFEQIGESRIYSKLLVQMGKIRRELLYHIDVLQYTEILKEHVSRLTDVLVKKDIKGKRKRDSISKALTPFDQRLLFYDEYYNSSIEPEDIEALRSSLQIKRNDEYTIFNSCEVYSRFQTYCVAMFPVEDLIRLILFDSCKQYNLIYVDMSKSTDEDPYSFYMLKGIVKDIRQWEMDCRLESIARDIANTIKEYIIFVFRKIYFDLYKDNDYRTNFRNDTSITREDMKQLLLNLYEVSRPKEFRDTMRELVKNTATVTATKNDKFKLTGDDQFQQRRLKAEKSNDNSELIANTTRLFDNLRADDSISFWTSFRIEK